MGAIVLDASKVNSYVLPNLVKSKNTMQDAYSTSQSLRNSLPSSFTYRSTINDIVNQLYNIKREISDIDTMISKKVERAKTIENRNDNRASGIAKAASSIGSIVGTIGGAKIGLATGGVVGAVAGAVVGNKVGNSVGKGLANTGAKIWNGFTSLCSNIWDGAKDLGKKIYEGCKKIVKKAASFVKEKVFPVIKNIGSAIWKGLKWIVKQSLRLGATIVNAVVSLVEGFVSFIEAIGDVVLLVVGVVGSVVGMIIDLCQGIFLGEWDWSATGWVWKNWILPWVAYDWTSKAFAWQGKWIINDWAYKPFQRGETGAKIVKGIGYVVGVVIASIFTAGGAAAASSAASAASASASTVATAFVQGGASAVSTFVTTGTATVAASSVTAVSADIAVKGTLAMSVSSGVVAGTAKTAQSIQSGYNKLSEEEKQSDEALLKLGGSSVLSGAVEGATWALTTGTLSKSVMNTATKKAALQATKAYATEGISVITDGEYDFKSATIDAGVSAGTSLIYDVGIKKGISTADTKIAEKITPQNMGSDTSSALDAMDDAASSTVTNKFLETTGKIVHGAKDVLDNKDASKIVGKIVKDPIKEGLEGSVEFVEEAITNSAA